MFRAKNNFNFSYLFFGIALFIIPVAFAYAQITKYPICPEDFFWADAQGYCWPNQLPKAQCEAGYDLGETRMGTVLCILSKDSAQYQKLMNETADSSVQYQLCFNREMAMGIDAITARQECK